MSFSTTLGGSGATRSRTSTGASTRALEAAAKAQEARALADALMAIYDLHRPEFLPAQPPVAPAPPRPDLVALQARHRKAALADVGVFDRRGRAAAKEAADRAAHAEAASIAEADHHRHQAYQAHLTELWHRLIGNDPDTVLGTLAEAFEDNEAAAAPVGVSGNEASVVVLVPSTATIPERKPVTTSAGNLSLKKLTKGETADFYRLLVCGYILITAKEALAVAPGLGHVRIVAVRNSAPDAYGRSRIEAVMAVKLSRDRLAGIQWTTADATSIVQQAGTDLVATLGRNKELTAISLDNETEIAALVEAFDADDIRAPETSRRPDETTESTRESFDDVLASPAPTSRATTPAHQSHQQLPPQGWYPDPSGTPRKRYWDGTTWTDHYTPTDPVAIPAPAPPVAPLQRVDQAPATSGPPSLADLVARMRLEQPRQPLDEQIEVAGETHHVKGIKRVFRDSGLPITPQGVTVEDRQCILVPERWNPHDPNAVAVMIGQHQVGYIPADIAADYSPPLLRLAAEGVLATGIARIWAKSDAGVVRARVTVLVAESEQFE